MPTHSQSADYGTAWQHQFRSQALRQRRGPTSVLLRAPTKATQRCSNTAKLPRQTEPAAGREYVSAIVDTPRHKTDRAVISVHQVTREANGMAKSG